MHGIGNHSISTYLKIQRQIGIKYLVRSNVEDLYLEILTKMKLNFIPVCLIVFHVKNPEYISHHNVGVSNASFDVKVQLKFR